VTPEQNLRRALVDNVPRDRMIEVIAKHLRNASRGGYRSNHNSTPRDWYRAGFVKKLA
jgi:hypothetical protein